MFPTQDLNVLLNSTVKNSHMAEPPFYCWKTGWKLFGLFLNTKRHPWTKRYLAQTRQGVGCSYSIFMMWKFVCFELWNLFFIRESYFLYPSRGFQSSILSSKKLLLSILVKHTNFFVGGSGSTRKFNFKTFSFSVVWKDQVTPRSSFGNKVKATYYCNFGMLPGFYYEVTY